MVKLMILCSMAVLALLLHGTTAGGGGNVGRPLPSGVANPCTQAAIDNGEFYFAYPNNKGKFIQCDEALNAYVLKCRNGLHWSQYATACDYPVTTTRPAP
ncbi:hypothetical protein V1264_006239 [Littorina saxatilis]|uniref:Chitin-binding type-2 domain-containing protein n=1 Tax=Littorina saxatilis TaxID=31220 RepID=A0AAN9G4Q0_9CAEN